MVGTTHSHFFWQLHFILSHVHCSSCISPCPVIMLSPVCRNSGSCSSGSMSQFCGRRGAWAAAVSARACAARRARGRARRRACERRRGRRGGVQRFAPCCSRPSASPSIWSRARAAARRRSARTGPARARRRAPRSTKGGRASQQATTLGCQIRFDETVSRARPAQAGGNLSRTRRKIYFF